MKGYTVFGMLAVACASLPVWAQGPSDAPRRESEASPRSVPTRDATRRFTGDIRVLSVPSPVRAGERWRYDVTVAPGARLLGPNSGETHVAQALMLSVQLADGLLAGAQEIGLVKFTRDAQVVEHPLRVSIAARRTVRVATPRPMRAALAGESIVVVYTVTNDGNAADSVRLAVDAPAGWQAELNAPIATRLAAGAAASIAVRVRPPRTLSAGSGLVTLRAVRDDGVSAAVVLVEVGAALAATPRGPELTMGAATVGGTTMPARAVYSLTMRGPVSEGLSIDAMLATSLVRDPLALRTAALLGAPVGGSRVRLSGARGAVDLGRVSLRLPELAGLSMGGEGVAGEWRMGRAGTIVAAGARTVRTIGDRGLQAAVQWTSAPAPLVLHVGASRLDEQSTTGRRLDAFSVGARYAPGRSGALSVELAERQFARGHGVGIATEATWERAFTRGRVRTFHAPGGASAFAPARIGAMAESQVGGNGRWLVSTQGWVMGDDAWDGATLRTSGGAVSPTLRLGTSADVGLTSSFTRYESGSGDSHRHDVQQELLVRGGIGRGALRWDGELGLERAMRGGVPGALGGTETTARRVGRAALALSTEFGTVNMRGSFRTATALLASEGTIDLQVGGIRPIPSMPRLTLEGNLQRVYLNRSAVSSMHAMLALEMPRGVRVLAGAQRDALLARDGRGAGTLFSLRVERSSVAPGFARLSQRAGVVYLDTNDNGTRDRGEPGLAGVIVRAGAESATTDRNGRFAMAAGGATPTVDLRSLGVGQHLGVATRAGSRDIPVRATTQLDVTVRRTETFGRQAAPVTIIVVARDSAGREWVMPTDGEGRAHFDALPAGLYTVTAESDNESVPLRIEPQSVRLAAGDSRGHRIELVSRGRPVRMQGGFNSQGTTQGIGATGGAPRGMER